MSVTGAPFVVMVPVTSGGAGNRRSVTLPMKSKLGITETDCVPVVVKS